MYSLYTSNNKAAVPCTTDRHYSVILFVSSILQHSLTISLTYSVFAGPRQAQCRGCWGNWTVGGSDWGAMSKQVSIITVFIVLVSPFPLSAAGLYAGLGNKQLYLINCATETCTFCLLSKYCILAGRRGRRDRLLPRLWTVAWYIAQIICYSLDQSALVATSLILLLS